MIVTRDEARLAGQVRYFTGVPCKNGHICERLVSSWNCVQCAVEKAARYREKNYSKWISVLANYREKNREKVRERTGNWRQRNLEKYTGYQANRRAVLRNSAPPLGPVEKEKIKAIYRLRAELTNRTGVMYHVDHIVPLKKGGRHHPDNLQIITASENLRKGCK